MIKKNDIIQIINSSVDDSLVGTLLQVTEVKNWGVQATMNIPYKGQAHFRLDQDDFIVVGKSPLMIDEEGNDDD